MLSPPTDSDAEMSKPRLFLPWWPQWPSEQADSPPTLETYHSRAHLPGPHEALLADLGAFDNLTGDEWFERAGQHAQQAGRTPIRTPMQRPMNVQGVGKQSQQCVDMGCMPGELETGDDIEYSAPIIPNSSVPALWGLKSMERQKACFDVRVNERKVYMGDDFKIVPGPRTRVIQMYPAESGHLMVPITHFGTKSSKGLDARQQGSNRLHLHQTTAQDEAASPDAPLASPQAQARVAPAPSKVQGLIRQFDGRRSVE